MLWPFGRYWRISPFVFWLVPRSHEWYGVALAAPLLRLAQVAPQIVPGPLVPPYVDVDSLVVDTHDVFDTQESRDVFGTPVHAQVALCDHPVLGREALVAT